MLDLVMTVLLLSVFVAAVLYVLPRLLGAVLMIVAPERAMALVDWCNRILEARRNMR